MNTQETQEIVNKIRNSDRPIQILFDVVVQALENKRAVVILLKELIEWL